MMERFQSLRPFSQIVALIVVGAVAYVVLSMLCTFVVGAFYPEMPTGDLGVQQEKYPVQFMIMYFLPLQAGFLLVPGIIYARWSSVTQRLRPMNWQGSLWSVFLFLVVFLLLPFFSEINNLLTELFGVHGEMLRQKMRSDDQMRQLIGAPHEISFVVGIVIVGGLTGIAEEFAFRRLLFVHLLKNTGKFWLSVVGSAFLFALLHFNYLQFIPLMVFGVALALIMYYSGNVWVGAVLHALNNMINLWWLSTDSFPSWMEEMDLKTTIPSTLLLMGLLYYQYYRGQKR